MLFGQNVVECWTLQQIQPSLHASAQEHHIAEKAPVGVCEHAQSSGCAPHAEVVGCIQKTEDAVGDGREKHHVLQPRVTSLEGHSSIGIDKSGHLDPRSYNSIVGWCSALVEVEADGIGDGVF